MLFQANTNTHNRLFTCQLHFLTWSVPINLSTLLALAFNLVSISLTYFYTRKKRKQSIQEQAGLLLILTFQISQ